MYSTKLKLEEETTISFIKNWHEISVNITEGNPSEGHARMCFYLSLDEAAEIGKKLIELSEL